MFDIGWSEMAIIMLLALIIIGPKDLPRVARTIGQWVRKGRMLAREFQSSLEDMAKEADLDDVKKEIEKVGRTDLKKAVESSIDPKGDLKKAFDVSSTDVVGKKALNGAASSEAGGTDAAKTTVTPAKAQPAGSSKTKPAAKTKVASSAKKKPAAADETPASTKAKPKAPKATAAKKKPVARKRTAKPAASTKSGAVVGSSDAPAADEPTRSSAVAAKPS